MRGSDAYSVRLLNLLFGSGDPAHYLLGLSTTRPTVAGGNISEPSGGAYARLTVPNDTANWTRASGTTRSVEISKRCDFPLATASWGTIVEWVLFMPDGTYAISGGLTPMAVDNGVQPYLLPGVVKISAPATGG